jgi:hypothetical protein
VFSYGCHLVNMAQWWAVHWVFTIETFFIHLLCYCM